MSVEIAESGAAARLRRLDRRRLARRAARLLAELGHRRSRLSISLVDDAMIRRVNRSHRHIDRATDVLSFSLLEGEQSRHRGNLLGDVVISLETARRMARAQRRSLDDTVARLLIHGLLHIVGFDHKRASEARVMRREERRLWRCLGR